MRLRVALGRDCDHAQLRPDVWILRNFPRSAEQREDPIGEPLTVKHRYGITLVSYLTPSNYMSRKSSFDLSRGVQSFTSILVCSQGWSSGPTVHVAVVLFMNGLEDEVD